jgi:hypothetical protein
MSEQRVDEVGLAAWQAALAAEVQAFQAETLRAVNVARPGHWMEDTEQVVKEAGERFRRRALEMLLQLRVQAGEGAFSPDGGRGVGEQGPAARCST